MNKLLIGSSIDCYPQYGDNKLTDTGSAAYTGTSFFHDQSMFPLPNSPDSYVPTKTSLSCLPASNTQYSKNHPSLFTSGSSITTSTADSSSNTGPCMENALDTNESSTFYSELYTNTDISYQAEHQLYQTPVLSTLSTPLVTSSPMSTSYSGTSSSPRSSISMVCPTLNLTAPNGESGSTFEGSVPLPPSSPSSSSSSSFNISNNHNQEKETNSPHPIPVTDSNSINTNTTELRRQIHIQSEQKRRAQIKCGFEELRNELPTCLNKKMSKVALLHRTVQHIQHLKSSQITILTELERLVQENEQLKRFQQTILQKTAMENMYPMP